MARLSFLASLRKKKILELVAPSEEIKQSYIEKSASNVDSAKILLKNNKLEEAIALTYYSMYHFVTALFFKAGIKSENHNATIQMLKEIFSIDNKELSYAKKERLDKQYYVNFKISKEEVAEAIKKAEIFNSFMNDFISKITNEEIKKARDKFEILTKN
jgi:uncharacterized protein (UPF0332 family)